MRVARESRTHDSDIWVTAENCAQSRQVLSMRIPVPSKCPVLKGKEVDDELVKTTVVMGSTYIDKSQVFWATNSNQKKNSRCFREKHLHSGVSHLKITRRLIILI